MNVIELLTKDHQKIIELFDQFDSLKEDPTKNRSKLEKIFSVIHSEIEVHTNAEEQFFYPEFQDEDEAAELVVEALKEHQAVRSILTELDREPIDAQWTAKMSGIKDSLMDHIEMEENDLFEKAVEILDEDEIELIGESIYQLKKAA